MFMWAKLVGDVFPLPPPSPISPRFSSNLASQIFLAWNLSTPEPQTSDDFSGSPHRAESWENMCFF